MTRRRVVVVGSGPSALACCLALIDCGLRPLVVDAGLEEDTAGARRIAGESGGLPDKLVRGSDHPYRVPEAGDFGCGEGVGIRPSYAFGGHSTVWGASILPLAEYDMHDWPVSRAQLAPHYEAVLRSIPFAGERDSLEERFPLYGNPSGCLRAGSRVEEILKRSRSQAQRVDRLVAGRSRLAVDARPPEDGGCHACAQCLDGCPDRLIFDAGDVFRRLQAVGDIEYRGRTLVRRWRREAGELWIDVEGLEGERRPSLPCAALFVAAGVLGTAEIAIRSRGLWGQEIRARDSQYFVGPLVSYRPEHVSALSTLAQVFIEIRYGQDPDQWAHCQVYPPSDTTRRAVQARVGRFPLGHYAAETLSRRVLAVQGFLPSRDSGYLSICVPRASASGPTVSATQGRTTDGALQASMRTLARQHRLLGGIFVPRLAELAEVGRSFHIGATFPMGRRNSAPTMSTSDSLGQLRGDPGVHLVDASVLPAVSGATITLTVMANAHRIASEVVSTGALAIEGLSS